MKSIKLEELKLIATSEVPPRRGRAKCDWDEFFDAVPVGKALVIQSEQIAPSTIRAALQRLHEKGKFKNFYVTLRKRDFDGKYTSYIVNQTEKET